MFARPDHNPAKKSAEGKAKSPEAEVGPKDLRRPNQVWRSLALGRNVIPSNALPSPLEIGDEAQAIDAVEDVLRSSGEPLDAGTRDDLGARLGSDLRGVRVHTDPQADTSARDLHARAYTAGSHIVFREGAYAPGTPSGKELLAHELTHVIQAGAGTPVAPTRVGRSPAPESTTPVTTHISRSGDREEHEADEIADRVIAGDNSPGAMIGPASPSTLRRDDERASSGDPVEILPDVSPEIDSLAQQIAAEIDQIVARGWDDASGGASLPITLMAAQVEHILDREFEQKKHGWQPNLRGKDAPLLQYYVAQYPGLRERLAIIRLRAGERFTPYIGKYLAIPIADSMGFEYEIHMLGVSGGEIAEGAANLVSIRYIEGGKRKWEQPYHFEGAGAGAGLAPWNANMDLGWNTFYTFEYWEPEDFIGPMTIAGGSVGFIIGYEVEGANIFGNAEHTPVGVDVGGWIMTTPDAGIGGFSGRLTSMGIRPSPPPDKGVLPPPPPFVVRPPVNTAFYVYFDTDVAALDGTATAALNAFVDGYREVFTGGDYELTLHAQASRLGDADYNQKLSEQRLVSVRQGIEGHLGSVLDESRVFAVASGEEEPAGEKLPEHDNSVAYRSVWVILRGKRHFTLPEP